MHAEQPASQESRFFVLEREIQWRARIVPFFWGLGYRDEGVITLLKKLVIVIVELDVGGPPREMPMHARPSRGRTARKRAQNSPGAESRPIDH